MQYWETKRNIMSQLVRLLNTCFGIRLCAGIALILVLLVPTLSLANNSNPDDIPPDTKGRSVGSRGCDTGNAKSSDSISTLVLLAPTQHLGRTTTTHPTFAWFVRDPGSWQMEFRLYRYDVARKESQLVKEIKDENFKSVPGIMVLSMSNPVLSIGQTYLWQVELICDLNHPSGNPFAETEMKVVQMPPQLKTEISRSSDKFNQATLYSKADLWYDTLELVLTSEEDPRMRKLKFSLLEEVATGEETALREQENVELRRSAIHQVQR